jgi:hypothetical protein
MGFSMEIFEARVLGGNLYLQQRFRGLDSVRRGVLPVFYSNHAAIHVYSILQ